MQRRKISFPRCCCALLCCVAVLFSTRSPPHAVLLVTVLSLSVVVRVLREGARVTWVCWCWLLCCRGALVLSPSSQSLVCRGQEQGELITNRYHKQVITGAVEATKERLANTARCYARDKTRHDQTPSPEGGSSFWGRFHTQGVGRSQQAAPGPSEIPAGSPRAIRISFSRFSGKRSSERLQIELGSLRHVPARTSD
jgi:hypothetical protein